MRPVFQPSPEDWPFLRRLLWGLLAIAVIVVLWRTTDLLLLAFGSVLGAVILRSAAQLFHRLGVRGDHLALAMGTALVLALFGLIGWLLVVQFGTELSGMIENLPGTLDEIAHNLASNKFGRALVSAAEAATAGREVANYLGSLLVGGGKVLINFLIILVGSMFIAANPDVYRRALVLLVPPAGREATVRALDQITQALRLWLKAKLISMTVMTILISTALWWAGLRSWAALGLLGGLSEFVPYVGPAVAMLPSIGLAAAAGGEIFWRVIAGYVVARLIEAYVLTPWVNRKVVDIPPALTLFVILGAGAVFGVYGLFFAGALLVVIFVGVRELYLRDTLGEEIEGVPRKGQHD